MKNLLFIAVASAALVACQNEPIVQGRTSEEAAANTADAAAAAKVVLPPSIVASKSYRCKDNSVVYVDWLSDGSARAKTDKAARAIPIKVGEAGTPSLSGDATVATVTYNGQSCKA
ncbi:MAG: hypothetical protein M3Q88_02595 [Pseudomonadota bacterium]|nr:hypothetical protein [Pseudomonadota bacterium]